MVKLVELVIRSSVIIPDRRHVWEWAAEAIDFGRTTSFAGKYDVRNHCSECQKSGLTVGQSHVSVGVSHPLEPGTHRVQGWRGKPFSNDDKGNPITGHTITVRVPPTGNLVMVYDSAVNDRAGNVRGPRATLVDWPSYSKQFIGGIASCRLKES